MRNAVAIVLAAAMLVTSAVIAAEFGALSGAPPLLNAPGLDVDGAADRERVIANFYESANAVLVGVPAANLLAVVSPNVLTHPSDGNRLQGPDALQAYLRRLSLRGGIHIGLVRIVDNGADIAAFVEARAPADASEGSPRAPLLWRTIDLLRIENGMIADYWPGEVGEAPPLPFAAATVPATPGDTGISLARIEFGPEVEPIALDAPQPHLLLVESGAFAATRDASMFIARAGERSFTALPAAAGTEEMLFPGDALLMTDAAGPMVRNAGESVATALSLLVAPRARLYSQVHPFPTDVVTVMGLHDAWRVGRELQWRSGAVTETLAIGMLSGDSQAGEIELRGEPIVLDPGQPLPPLPPGNLRLAIVRSGTVSVTGLDSVADSPSDVTTTGLASSPKMDGVFWAGDAFTIDPGKSPRIANVGLTRADLLLLEVDRGFAGDTERPRPPDANSDSAGTTVGEIPLHSRATPAGAGWIEANNAGATEARKAD